MKFIISLLVIGKIIRGQLEKDNFQRLKYVDNRVYQELLIIQGTMERC